MGAVICRLYNSCFHLFWSSSALHCTALHCTALHAPRRCAPARHSPIRPLTLPYLTLGLCRQEPRTTVPGKVVLLHVTRRSPLRNAHVNTSTHVAKSSRLTSATNTPHLIAVCPRAVVAFTCLFWKSTHAKSGWPAMLFCQC
ncbi:hypothetical protein IWX47DRAFT_400768 [Phyllosticta citricarpa]